MYSQQPSALEVASFMGLLSRVMQLSFMFVHYVESLVINLKHQDQVKGQWSDDYCDKIIMSSLL